MLEQTIHLLSDDASLSGIHAAAQEWKYHEEWISWDRQENLLFLNYEGSRDYYLADGTVMHVQPGDLLLMPTGCSYRTYSASPEGSKGYSVLFNARNRAGEEICLDTHPRLAGRDHNGFYEEKMRQLVEWYLQGGFSTLRAKSLLYEILYAISTDLSLIQDNPKKRSLIQAVRYMENNLQKTCSIEQLAEICFMSRSTFHRLFQQEFGDSPLNYHMTMRIKKSQELLQSGLYTVEKVAEIMGFCDTGYFSRMFHKITGQYAGKCRPALRRPPTSDEP